MLVAFSVCRMRSFTAPCWASLPRSLGLRERDRRMLSVSWTVAREGVLLSLSRVDIMPASTRAVQRALTWVSSSRTLTSPGLDALAYALSWLIFFCSSDILGWKCVRLDTMLRPPTTISGMLVLVSSACNSCLRKVLSLDSLSLTSGFKDVYARPSIESETFLPCSIARV